MKSSRDNEFTKCICGYISISGLTQKDLSDRLNMSYSTFRVKLKNPDEFRRGELRRLCTALRVKDEDKKRLYGL